MSLAGILLASGSALASTQVYSNDFSSGAGSEWSNNTTSTDNGEAFLGGANGFGNGTDTLSLSGLAAHTEVTVSFDLYVIQSMDGNGPAGGGLDEWKLTSSGSSLQTLIDTSFANYGGDVQSFGGSNGSGGYLIAPLNTTDPSVTYAPKTGSSAEGHLGFGTGDFGDTTYSLSFTFADSSSSLALAFESLQNQAPGDEGWGLDNVVVSTNADVTGVGGVVTPLPAGVWTGGLMMAALAGYTMFRRRGMA
jgi:hypothetical protein